MKHLLIGDNAFLGVSHLSQSRGRSRRLSLDTDAKVKIIEQAASCGATGFTFSTDPTNFQILRSLAISDQIARDFAIHPVLPYAARYVRAINEKGITGLMSDVLSQLSIADKAKLIVQGTISTLTFDPIGAMMAYIDSELSQIPRNANIQSVFLHEVITDLGVSFGATEMFQSLTQHIRSKWNTVPGFVTRNFPKLVSFFNEMNLPLTKVAIMTPFNSIGFQMNPSREACERSLFGLQGTQVFAMSVMAGGYLPLENAARYLGNLQNISGIVVGVSSTAHAYESFTALASIKSH